MWAVLRAILGILEPSGGVLDHLGGEPGCLGGVLGGLGGDPGRLGDVLGRLGGVLEAP